MSEESRTARMIAAIVVAAGSAIVLAGCAPGPTFDGAYISITDGATNLLIVEGASLTMIDPVAGGETCDVIDQAFEDFKNGAISDRGGPYEIAQRGTLNEGNTTAVWIDEGPGAVTVDSDMITVENVFNASRSYDEIVFVARDSEQADAFLLDYCG
ncbi:hypothetical protein K8F61_09660 [Microbacterium resistens]|uniref:Uncharacterized protein n=1 Tax=Microbacterium resistens TaxID=156977 RepID=A0ABY3RMF7_9MICO|nr:hypothetical protein [Microbacterium resistens]UGS24978.1 hypothetical protein K8F61_09660 [Microbacterium resistens]